MNSICVQCGSSAGDKEIYKKAAADLGEALAKSGITAVYGGSSVGLMGEFARSVLDNSGRVIGIIPEHIQNMVEMLEVSQLYVVKTMHERKQKMFDLSDGFIALPGGFGTFEEFLEIVTWAQLERHSKPSALYNVAGYYDKFLDFLDHAVIEKFIRPQHRQMLIVSDNPYEIIERMKNYVPPKVKKWWD